MESLGSKKKTGLIILGLGAAAAAIWYASSEASAATPPDGNADPLPPDLPSGATPGYSMPSDQTRSYDPYAATTNYPSAPQQLTGPLPSAYSQRGDPTVQLYQQKLLDLGYDPGPIDGLNGSFTRRAVMDYQRDNSLTVDGILGPRTKASLDAASGQAAPVSGLVGRKTHFWRAAGAASHKHRGTQKASPTSGLGGARRWRA